MKLNHIFISLTIFLIVFASKEGEYNKIISLDAFSESEKYKFPSLNDYSSAQGTLLVESCGNGPEISVGFSSSDQSYVYSGLLPSYRKLSTVFSDSASSPTFTLELSSKAPMNLRFAIVPFNLHNPEISQKNLQYDSEKGHVFFNVDEASDVEYAAIFCSSDTVIPYSSCGLKKLPSTCEMTNFEQITDGKFEKTLTFEEIPDENGFIVVVARRTSVDCTDIHNMAISFYNRYVFTPYPASKISPWILLGILVVILAAAGGFLLYLKKFGLPAFLQHKKKNTLIERNVYDQI
eukprot:TRINITY_DN1941_c0_g1_i1.p1 TRINITY_DN1941_c0_g1~~TRINITY_DN1941_c0_g1_i1.p1  ORF type:complete len:304 (+),score=92.38 TRINITY_DN1941_c0_g1_i1:37-912(+)